MSTRLGCLLGDEEIQRRGGCLPHMTPFFLSSFNFPKSPVLYNCLFYFSFFLCLQRNHKKSLWFPRRGLDGDLAAVPREARIRRLAAEATAATLVYLPVPLGLGLSGYQWRGISVALKRREEEEEEEEEEKEDGV